MSVISAYSATKSLKSDVRTKRLKKDEEEGRASASGKIQTTEILKESPQRFWNGICPSPNSTKSHIMDLDSPLLPLNGEVISASPPAAKRCQHCQKRLSSHGGLCSEGREGGEGGSLYSVSQRRRWQRASRGPEGVCCREKERRLNA